MITIYEPDIKPYSKHAIRAIESGWISNHGEYVEKSVNQLKQIMNVQNCILMANGTCATHCLFLSIKYKYPDIQKIYVPNNAYVAAFNSALMVYNINQLEVMEMDINTWNINTREEYILSLDTNSAVLIVHNLGNIINVPRLKTLRPDLIFVEDNCEGLFGKYNDIYSGTSSDILCSSISFYGNKIITTGEGGAFLTQHKDVYDYIVKVYSQGMSNVKYLHEVHAYNYRMTNVQAAFLYDQLNDINNILNRKRMVFDNYKRLLQKLIEDGKIKIFENEEYTENADWIFSIRIVGNTKSIEETTSFFRDLNVEIRPFFYPINDHNHLSSIPNNDKVSKILNTEIIMIPSSPNITVEEQMQVTNSIHKFVFYLNTNFKILELNNENQYLLNTFIHKITSSAFRYFKNRTIDIIKNHLITILLMDNDVSIGYAHIDVEDGKYWFGICISDEYQSRGLGHNLMKYIFNHYKMQNIKEVYLTVDNNNTNAIRLYKKYNFKELKVNETYMLMNKNIEII